MRKILYVVLLAIAGCKGVDTTVNLTYKDKNYGEVSIALKPR